MRTIRQVSVTRRYARVLSGSILVAALGGLLAGAFGGYWIPLDILAHFRGHLIAVALVSGFAFLVPRFGLAILVVGLLAVPIAHAGMSGLVYSKTSESESKLGQRLKVVSLNMWGAYSDLDRIESYLRGENADIVVLTEFPMYEHPMLRKLKPVYPHQIFCTAGCRMALLSKWKWIKAGTQRRTDKVPKYVWAQFGFGSEALTVYGIHLRTPIDSPRLKAREIRWLGQQLGAKRGSVILAGDFNSTPWSHNFRELSKVAGLRKPSGVYPTWPVSRLPLPQLAIDHILVSEGIMFERMHVGKRVSSDHLPVVAELVLTGH